MYLPHSPHLRPSTWSESRPVRPLRSQFSRRSLPSYARLPKPLQWVWKGGRLEKWDREALDELIEWGLCSLQMITMIMTGRSGWLRFCVSTKWLTTLYLLHSLFILNLLFLCHSILYYTISSIRVGLRVGACASTRSLSIQLVDAIWPHLDIIHAGIILSLCLCVSLCLSVPLYASLCLYTTLSYFSVSLVPKKFSIRCPFLISNHKYLQNYKQLSIEKAGFK